MYHIQFVMVTRCFSRLLMLYFQMLSLVIEFNHVASFLAAIRCFRLTWCSFFYRATDILAWIDIWSNCLKSDNHWCTLTKGINHIIQTLLYFWYTWSFITILDGQNPSPSNRSVSIILDLVFPWSWTVQLAKHILASSQYYTRIGEGPNKQRKLGETVWF